MKTVGLLGLALLLLGQTACGTARYREAPADAGLPRSDATAWVDRRVDYRLDWQYLSHRPKATLLRTVLAPGLGKIDPELLEMVSQSAARHLYSRFAKVVIAPASAGQDDALLAAATAGCDSVMNVTVEAAGPTFLMIWAGNRVDLSFSLVDVGSGQELWQARHAATRSSGGLAINPIGFALASASAAGFVADDDVMPSLVDDAIRRSMASLPASGFQP